MGLTRARPLLGTFVTISCAESSNINSDLVSGEASAAVSAAMTAAFLEGERLQAVFSALDPNSELSRLNACREASDISSDLAKLIERAEHLQKLSEQTFRARNVSGAYDLAGLAKGAIVDAMAECLQRCHSDFNGVINAGGDLRFIGSVERKVAVRLGPIASPLMREVVLQAPHIAFASSSLNVAATDERSSTRYFLPLAPGLSEDHTVCVAARECWMADALTKVGLHASADVAERVAQDYEASLVIFDAVGGIVAVRGKR